MRRGTGEMPVPRFLWKAESPSGRATYNSAAEPLGSARCAIRRICLCSRGNGVDPTKASPVVGAGAFTLDAVVLSPTSVTLNGTSGCGPDHAKPHYTRHGWKLHARFGKCGRPRRVSLLATVDPSCKQLQGKLRT